MKFFNTERGYGFIAPEDGSKDAFVHISAMERAGISSLSEGQKVEYELQPGRNGKSSAENLRLARDIDVSGTRKAWESQQRRQIRSRSRISEGTSQNRKLVRVGRETDAAGT